MLALLAYLVAGTIGGIIPRGSVSDAGPRPHNVLLVKGPIHTDIAVRASAAVVSRFAPQRAADPAAWDAAGWVLFGWGARDFYTTTGTYADLSIGPVWRAVTGDAAVMRVDPIPAHWVPQDVTTLALTDAQHDRLLAALAAGFAQPVHALDHPGFTATDRFFEGAGRFHILRTCNVWVGDVLGQADVDVGVWTPFTWSLP